MDSTQVSDAAVYGGGGLFGIAYNLGVAEALVDAGVPLGRWPALGTSAGSWAGAGLALGVRFTSAIEAIADVIPRFPDPRPGRLRAIAAEVFGHDTLCPSLSVVVSALPWFRRTVLSGAEHPVADLVAASSAVPGLLAPQRIAGTRYVDGGVRAMASIDLAEPARRLLVVLPLAGPMFGPFGRLVERRVRGEIDQWRERVPDGETIVVRPSEEIARLARRPDQLFDTGRAVRCHELARAQGESLVRRMLPG
jgi:NTE family protein